MRGAQALRDAAEELARVAPVDGVAALRLLADLRCRYRAVAVQLDVPQSYVSSLDGEAGVFAAGQAEATAGAVHSPTSSERVDTPTLDSAYA